MSTLRRKIGSLLREWVLYAKILQMGRRKPAVLFFPSQGLEDGASRLRAYAIADHLRELGWRAVACPKHLDLSARRRVIAAFCPDVIVMQTARHDLNRPRLFPGVPVVIDLDDADYINPCSAGPLVEALSASVGAIAGSRAVARFCRLHVEPVTIVWTGTPPSTDNVPGQLGRAPIVTWAASSPVGSRGEADFVGRVLQRLVEMGVEFSFRCYSDDGSAAYREMVERTVPASVPLETFPYMPYVDFLASLDEVSVGLAPLTDLDGFSGGKSFGKVLAYVDRNVPVVSHPVVDHPLFFRNWKNGVMADEVEDWASAIARLLKEPALRNDIARAARTDLRRRLSTEKAASLVNEFLRKTVLQP